VRAVCKLLRLARTTHRHLVKQWLDGINAGQKGDKMKCDGLVETAAPTKSTGW